ncbi:DUF423 domain-containing protein [Arsenophonus sp.]|uniref:DUF423 domain-containing protein n=1 Tax=Arsenophonus sp. TaxID=1872640 RepID=UPI002857B8C1|nr:DUF423 domain-containing protein [Arsenophonus sp.]MDR5616436.1 DUF423 domain-containing protein [Arsenophonus sp.]
MNARLMLIFSGISGFFCVTFGAIGSHLLSPLLNHDQIEWIRIGLRYQSMHTLVLMILGAILLRKVILWFYWGGIFFSIGILLFSGSFYCMALLQAKYFAHLAPVGGFCFLIGWILIVIGATRLRNPTIRHE